MLGLMERFVYFRIFGLISYWLLENVFEKICINDEFVLYFLIDINEVYILVVWIYILSMWDGILKWLIYFENYLLFKIDIYV